MLHADVDMSFILGDRNDAYSWIKGRGRRCRRSILRKGRMKNIILGLAVTLACASGSNASSLPEVTFEWFNHSTNEIWVTNVIGLPAVASPGRLMPTSAEGRLETKSSTFLGRVRIRDRITVKWKDNGEQGWPGGLKKPGSTPLGAAHQPNSSGMS